MKSWRISSIRKPNKKAVIPLLALLTMLAAVLSLCFGAEAIPIGEAVSAMLRDDNTSKARWILEYVRLPRTCACLLAGSALAVAGVLIQSVLANPLAAPSTIGVNSGAGLAVAIWCTVFPTGIRLMPFAALFGAFAGVMLVMTVAEYAGSSKITLVLSGVAVSAIFSAGIDAVVTFVPDALNGYSDFRIGGFSNMSMEKMSVAVWLILGGIVFAMLMHNELDVLMLGADQAQALGLPAKKLRIVFLALGAALAGSAVSFSGLLGFVGLIVPHIMRRLVGEESGMLIPSSALGGACLLCLCDLLARVLFAPFELSVGIVMSLLGGPFFIWLLAQRKGSHG